MDINQLIEDILEDISWRTNEGYPDFNNQEHLDILYQVLGEHNVPKSIIESLVDNLKEAKPKIDPEKILDKKIKNPRTGREVKVKTALGYSEAEPVKKKADALMAKAGVENPEEGGAKGSLKISEDEKQKLSAVFAGKNIQDLDKPASKIAYAATKLAAIVGGEKVKLSKEDIDFMNNEFAISSNPASNRFYYMSGGKMVNNKLPKAIGTKRMAEIKAALIDNAEAIMKANPGLKLHFKANGTRVPLDAKTIKAVMSNRKATSFKPQSSDSIGVSHIKQHKVSDVLDTNTLNKFKEMGYDTGKVEIYNGKIDTKKPETSVSVLSQIHGSLTETINAPHIDESTKAYMNKFADEMGNILNSNLPAKTKMATLNKKLSDMASAAVTSASELGEDEGRNVLKDFGETLTYMYLVSGGEEVYMPAGGTFPIADLIRIKGDKDNPTKIDQVSIKSAYGNASVDGAASSAPEVLGAIRSQLKPEDQKKLDEVNSLHDKSIDRVDLNKLSPERRKQVTALKSLGNVKSKDEAIKALTAAGFSTEESTRTLEKFFEKKVALIEAEKGVKIKDPYKNASTLLKEYAYRNYVAKESNAFFKSQKGTYPVSFVVVSNSTGHLDVAEKGQPNISDIEIEEKGSIEWYVEDGKIISPGYKYGNMGARPKHKKH